MLFAITTFLKYENSQKVRKKMLYSLFLNELDKQLTRKSAKWSQSLTFLRTEMKPFSAGVTKSSIV